MAVARLRLDSKSVFHNLPGPRLMAMHGNRNRRQDGPSRQGWLGSRRRPEGFETRSKHLSQREIASAAGINAGRVDQAETVIHYALDLTDAVIDRVIRQGL